MISVVVSHDDFHVPAIPTAGNYWEDFIPVAGGLAHPVPSGEVGWSKPSKPWSFIVPLLSHCMLIIYIYIWYIIYIIYIKYFLRYIYIWCGWPSDCRSQQLAAAKAELRRSRCQVARGFAGGCQGGRTTPWGIKEFMGGTWGNYVMCKPEVKERQMCAFSQMSWTSWG